MTEPAPGKIHWGSVCEVPLAIASYVLFRATRAGLQILSRLHQARHPAQARRWQLIDAKFLARPGALPVLLTTAPRWNPHATIATLGPIQIDREITFEADTARAACPSWFFVLYSHPDRRTLACVSSLDTSAAGWPSIRVPAPGRYLLAARYYSLHGDARFPAVRIDGQSFTDGAPAPRDANRFYETLHRRANPFYYCLAYHCWPMLRSSRLPRPCVERTFLPVGNPETEFRYGTIERGQRVDCRMNASHFETWNLFVTIYSRHSLPVLWYQVSPGQQGPGTASPVQGFYLIRLQRTSGQASPAVPADFSCRIVGESPRGAPAAS